MIEIKLSLVMNNDIQTITGTGNKNRGEDTYTQET